MSDDAQTDERREYISQCAKATEEIIQILRRYPRPVAYGVLPGVLALVAHTLNQQRDNVMELVSNAISIVADMEAGRKAE